MRWIPGGREHHLERIASGMIVALEIVIEDSEIAMTVDPEIVMTVAQGMTGVEDALPEMMTAGVVMIAEKTTGAEALQEMKGEVHQEMSAGMIVEVALGETVALLVMNLVA
jgi:hypothetical protein